MIKSGYSFKTAVGNLDDVVSRIKEIGWTTAPLADFNSTFGFTRWTKLCKQNNLHPVYGVQLPVVVKLGESKPVSDLWQFFAIDHLRPLHDLIELATSQDGLTYDQALSAEGVIAIARERCQLNEVYEVDKNAKGAGSLDPDRFFIGLSPATPKGLFNEAKKAGYRFLATSCNVYPRAEDQEFYRVTLGKRANIQTYPQHILSGDEWLDACKYIACEDDLYAALTNREDAIDLCTATMKKATLLVPEKPKTLRQMCIERIKCLGNDRSMHRTYMDRLKRELSVITQMGNEDYFYILADMMRFARASMICGPGRGSSCGSLVCYLLGITAVDPIKYDLLFERFLDPTRTDSLPDIDVDLDDEDRHLVLEYLETKYGNDRIAHLGTVGMFGAKSAMNQLCEALQLPRWNGEEALSGLLQRNDGDARALNTLQDTLETTEKGRKFLAENPTAPVAYRMEGHPSYAGTHAAGLVLTQDPVQDIVAVDARSGTTMCDMKDAEDLGLLKIDALGLTQLSVFKRTLELMDKVGLSLNTIPLNDPVAFDVLNNGHFAGIFQFAGDALKNICRQMKVTCLDDMMAITSLARPGPDSENWVRRKVSRTPVIYPHPLLEPILKDTLGIIIYQEQVMRICREIGDLSWEDVNAIRRGMGKTLGKEYLDKFGDQWKRNAEAKGIDPLVCKMVWNDLLAHGKYSFNKSHAVAYSIVSYWCCWLKAHHPSEFIAATLDAEKDPQKQIALLRELKDEGIDYVAVDPDHSTDRWTLVVLDDGSRRLVGPLSAIKNIGPAATMEIVDSRASGKPLREALRKRLEAATTEIDTLYPVSDRVKQLHPDLSAINIISKPTPIIDVQCGKTNGEVLIIGVAVKIDPKDENAPEKIAQREAKGWRGRFTGPTQALNLFIQDDTDKIFAKIDRFNFQSLARPVIDRGRQGKALYALKGSCPPGFRMISVSAIKYLGDMEND